MRIAFLGSGAFGIPTLEHLARGHEVVAVVSQPDRPAGRGRELTPTPIAAWATANLAGVPVLKPADVNEPGVVSRFHELAAGADAWVIIAFGQKLGGRLLTPPSPAPSGGGGRVGEAGGGPLACNLHASLLPRWRGAGPINAAILAGDTQTGNSVITIAERMDAGLVLGQSTCTIPPTITAGELHDLLAADGPALIERVLDEHAKGTLRPVMQDESAVTRARKLSRADARLDFAKSAEECRRRINGLSPWPGVTVGIGGNTVKLLRADSQQNPVLVNGAAGTLIDPARGHVACGGRDDGSTLVLMDVQPAGGKPMTWDQFVRGRSPAAGTRLTGGEATC